MFGFVLAVLISGVELVEGNFDGKTITVEGRAIGFTESGFAVKVDDVPLTVIVEERPVYLKACSVTQPLVEITGVLEQVYGSTASGQREGVVGLRLRPRSEKDLVFRPDWRFFFNPFTLGVLVLLLVGSISFLSRRQLKTRTLMAERKRMADDLHDTIEQHLVGAGMLLKLNRNKEAQEILVRAKREIRDIVWGLKNDDMMRLTPADMLRKLAHEENTKGIYRVDTRLEGLPATMDAAAMRDLSLIVRESIGNAVKHGGAKKIAISSDPLGNGGWRLRVSNDGAPFDPESAPGAKEGHFGIEGMKQRARRIGATARFERRGEGMVLILEKRAQ